jgi:hypothetical protein
MSRTEELPMEGAAESTHRQYILDVRIVEISTGDGTRYRFEAPRHEGLVFDSAGDAELYADVYFDVNGFEEAGTGERGVPPEIIQAGRDTLAAYFCTQPYTDRHWVASFFGKEPGVVERYVETVRRRAREIREGAVEQGVASPSANGEA